MKDKFISTQSNKILTYFNQMNRDCFDYSEVKNWLLTRQNERSSFLIQIRMSINYYATPWKKYWLKNCVR